MRLIVMPYDVNFAGSARRDFIESQLEIAEQWVRDQFREAGRAITETEAAAVALEMEKLRGTEDWSDHAEGPLPSQDWARWRLNVFAELENNLRSGNLAPYGDLDRLGDLAQPMDHVPMTVETVLAEILGHPNTHPSLRLVSALNLLEFALSDRALWKRTLCRRRAIRSFKPLGSARRARSAKRAQIDYVTSPSVRSGRQDTLPTIPSSIARLPPRLWGGGKGTKFRSGTQMNGALPDARYIFSVWERSSWPRGAQQNASYSAA